MSYLLQQRAQDVRTVRDLHRSQANQWKKHTKPMQELLSNNSHNFCDLYKGLPISTEVKSNINLTDEVNASMVPRPKTMWLLCMDERIQYYADSHRSLSFGLPGCECLLTLDQKATLIEELLQVAANHTSVEEIIVTSHSSCGAVNAALQKEPNKILNRVQTILSKNTQFCDRAAKSYAHDFAKMLSDQARKTKQDLTIRTLHLDNEQLHCPKFHNAVGAVVNYTSDMNVSELVESLDLPLFNIYAGAQTPELVVKNIELAISIAASKHGFNKQFSEELPFIILFTGKNNEVSSVIEQLRKQVFPIPVVYSII
jgi:carbonic anhydrase